MKWVFYFLVVGVAIFFMVQYFVGGGGLGVKERALSWPPDNQSEEEKAAAREQLRILRQARDDFLDPRVTTSGNDTGLQMTMTETDSLAKNVYAIRIENPLYVEILETFESEGEASDLANQYCYYLKGFDRRQNPLPLGPVYITVLPENRKEITAERVC